MGMTYNSYYKKLIHSADWQRTRHAKMKSQVWCEDCLSEGRHELATEVHHIVPVGSIADRNRQRRMLLDPNNLRSLCHRCHIARHIELGKQTTEDVRRRRHNETNRFNAVFFGKDDVGL